MRPAAFTGERLGVRWTFALMVFGGVGLGATYALPWSMMPDAIEWEAVRSGMRREGAYYGIWTFCSKIGQALSIAVFVILGRIFWKLVTKES